MSKVNLRQSGQGWDDFDFEESVPKAAVPRPAFDFICWLSHAR